MHNSDVSLEMLINAISNLKNDALLFMTISQHNHFSIVAVIYSQLPCISLTLKLCPAWPAGYFWIWQFHENCCIKIIYRLKIRCCLWFVMDLARYDKIYAGTTFIKNNWMYLVYYPVKCIFKKLHFWRVSVRNICYIRINSLYLINLWFQIDEQEFNGWSISFL